MRGSWVTVRSLNTLSIYLYLFIDTDKILKQYKHDGNCGSENLQGVTKNMEDDLGLLIDLLIRMISPSSKTNMRKIIVMLTEFYKIL